MLNEMTITANLKRIDICDLRLACTILDQASDENTTKWSKLHGKLDAILEEFDAKLKYTVKDARGKEIATFARRREAELFIAVASHEYTLTVHE